jgi:hypothetical protein
MKNIQFSLEMENHQKFQISIQNKIIKIIPISCFINNFKII